MKWNKLPDIEGQSSIVDVLLRLLYNVNSLLTVRPVCFLCRMSPVEAAASGLKQCKQAQDQLEDAISGVMKAEQQLRGNAREVSTFIVPHPIFLLPHSVWFLSDPSS